MKHCLLIFLLAVAIVGAGPVTAEEMQRIERDGFSFVLPRPWRIPEEEQPEAQTKYREKIVLITKDGAELEQIELYTRTLPMWLSNANKSLNSDLRPHEMAEFILNDFELDTSMKNLIIHENKPVTLGGCPAFRLVFSYRKAGTLHYKCVQYGFQKNDMFYSVRYTAPLRHYFETYLRAFETIAASLTVTDDTRPGETGAQRKKKRR